MEELKKLKIRLQIKNNDKDDLLTLMLEEAEACVLDYTNRFEVNDDLKSVIREVAILSYNRLGSEAESSRNEGGISVSYEFPEALRKRLNSLKMLKMWRIAHEN